MMHSPAVSFKVIEYFYYYCRFRSVLQISISNCDQPRKQATKIICTFQALCHRQNLWTMDFVSVFLPVILFFHILLIHCALERVSIDCHLFLSVSVIGSFRSSVSHSLVLELGETVQILEKCDGKTYSHFINHETNHFKPLHRSEPVIYEYDLECMLLNDPVICSLGWYRGFSTKRPTVKVRFVGFLFSVRESDLL